MRFRTILALILFASALHATGREKRFSRTELIEDAEFIRTTLREVHPDAFAVYPEEEFERDFRQMNQRLRDSMTAMEFFMEAAPLLHRLGDGHTGMYPSLDLGDRKEEKILFPLIFSIDKRTRDLIVEKEWRSEGLTVPSGARIVRIDGIDAPLVVRRLTELVSGEEEYFRIHQLNHNGTVMNYLLPMLLEGETFRIEYEFGGRREELELGPRSVVDLFKVYGSMNSNKERPDYSFDIIGDSIGLIEFNRFQNMEAFKTFLQETFLLIREKNIRNLVIDLRSNGGGNSTLGDELFQYISPAAFQSFGLTTIRYSRQIKERMKSKQEYADGEIVVEDWGKLIPLRENELRYDGRLFLLIGNGTFSSASMFSWAFRYFGMGTVVGEPTGGQAVAFGDIYRSRLPNTGLNMATSWKHFYGYGATDQDRHGILPDYEVPEEEALEFTLKLIEGKK